MTVRATFVIPWLIIASPALAADAALPPELTPYRVSLSVTVEDSPEFSGRSRSRMRQDINRLIGRTFGERWVLSEGLPPRGMQSLDRMTVETVAVDRREVPATTRGLPTEAAPDKSLFVSVATDWSGFVASAREWDRLTDTLGPVRTATAAATDDLPRAALRAIAAAFRPVAVVGRGDTAAVPLTLKADAIPSPDPGVADPKPGTLLTVVFRRLDRDGDLIEIRPVPFTLLRVGKTGGATATAELISALRSPLGVRRGRFEAWAIAAPVAAESTRLTVTRRGDGVPLVGRVVEIRPQPFTPGKEEPPPERILLTDRAGAVTLPADPKRPLLWLTIRSGDATLMRLPIAPGLERTVTLPLGDDQRRLATEGRLSILTGELIETVAKRATLLASARASARAGQYAKADVALAEAAKLPEAAEFRRRLAAVETPAAKAAEEERDRLAAARIRALGRQAGGLIDRYLNPDALRVTREEVEELKRTDPDLPSHRPTASPAQRASKKSPAKPIKSAKPESSPAPAKKERPPAKEKPNSAPGTPNF